MKIEKINENQIRCTLTKDDLTDRELKLSELAYGTDKVKSLFRDMMQQAAFEFGFEADDIPLMIEAIPLSPDCIILVITKVEDPEELDTRFAKFAPTVSSDDDTESAPMLSTKPEGADDILGLLEKIYEARVAALDKNAKDPLLNDKETAKKYYTDLTKLYLFNNLDSVIGAAHALINYFNGYSTLYKNQTTNSFALLISKLDHTPEEFNKICNILSEYGSTANLAIGTESHLREHGIIIIESDALQQLSTI